jgi:predicted metalloprotease
MPPAPIIPPPAQYSGYASAAQIPPRWSSEPPHGHGAYPPPRPPAGQYPTWGYGGWPPPPPPRKSGIGRILLGFVGLAAALFFALIVIGAAVGTGNSDTAGGIDHTPARPDGGPAQTPDSAAALLRVNPIYRQGGLSNGDCPAEDLGDADRSDQTRFYKALMGCLGEEWRPPIEAAGFTYEQPGLVVFDSPVQTPCGGATPEDGRTLAFYCPSDAIMYADVPQMRKFFGAVDVAYAIVIGHEFGHHVQFDTRILDAYDELVYDDYATRLELSRRIELQASCMGGLFLGAIAESFPVDNTRLDQLERVAASFGDAPDAPANQQDHGSGQSNHDWIMRAFFHNDIATCNTFTAPEELVD